MYVSRSGSVCGRTSAMISHGWRSSSGSTSYLPASSNHTSTSSLSLSERLPRSHAGVVVEDDQDVGRALGRARRHVGVPIGYRVADVDVDLSVERTGHPVSLARA